MITALTRRIAALAVAAALAGGVTLVSQAQPASALPIAWHCAAINAALIHEYHESGFQNPYLVELYTTWCV